MCTKGFKVVIELDIHAVTCPGVWLCPNGKVCLKIKMLGYSSQTKCLPPVFPLLFHEKFVFEKLISTCRQLADLQKYFGAESVHAELIQKAGPNCIDGIILATFEITLTDFLYPSTSRRGVLTGVDIDLLMEPSSHFPGILAPKVEISTKTTVEEINLSLLESKRGFINPKTLRSKMASKQLEPTMKSKLVRRGHPLCHCCWKKGDRPPFVVRHTDGCDLARTPAVFKTIPPLPGYCECVISHRSGNCSVCNLYKKYFPKNQMERTNQSFKLNNQNDAEFNSVLQPMADSSCSDDSNEALPSKSWDISLPEKNKQHFTDYGFSSRLTSELSRRVRHATGGVGYPFLQTDKDICKCCTRGVCK